MTQGSSTAIIIGASRGLGLGLVRAYLAQGWNVVATVRVVDGNAALAGLAGRYVEKLRIEVCDIANDHDIATLSARLFGKSASLLFVNAGISNGPGELVEELSSSALGRLLATNALGPLKAIHTLKSLVDEDGVIAVMSSGLASIANNTDGGWEGYRASKSALNTFMRSYAARHPDDTRAYLAISPGWVKTDMGGEEAPLDVDTSVAGILNVIKARRGRRGVAFVNYLDESIPW